MKKGFTLVELIIVIIIVGILASLGLSQYTKVVEKSRAAEARSILGALRGAEIAEYYENGAYVVVGSLGIGAPAACATTHYFVYSCTTDGTCTATRCTGTSKSPKGATSWTKTLTINGVWGGTAGY